MVDYNLIEDLKLPDGEVERLLREAYGDKVADGEMDTLISKELSGYARAASSRVASSASLATMLSSKLD